MANAAVCKVEEIQPQHHFCTRCCKEEIRDREAYYVVLDLEMCTVPRNTLYRYQHEIIQIGAVKVNRDFEIISEFSTYVRPEYGSLDWRIKHLTGITESQLKTAPFLQEALDAFECWMGDRVTKLYAWSDSDYIQIENELTLKHMTSKQNQKLLELNWIDFQKYFMDRFSFHRNPSLEDAMHLAEVDAKGSYHNGLDDAANTARLIQKLILNPEYQLSGKLPAEKHEVKSKGTHLQVSLGEMFADVFGAIR
ncbi:MAG: exonuclease domain-containing protein [Clostridiales bacterium]|nr:exonuclease domain-containing protein [Candidatus Blautia equi]